MPQRHTFKAWARAQRPGNNARGDFIRDLRRDRDFSNAKTLAEVDHHLGALGACAGAREVAARLWHEWDNGAN